MTRVSTRFRTAGPSAAGALLVLALSACTGSAGGTPAASAGSVAAGGAAVTPSAAPSKAPLAPLDAFFAQMNGDKDAVNAANTKVQTSIAACMAAQGFQYTPVPNTDENGGTAAASDNPNLQWGTKAYAAQYGYGTVAAALSDPTQGEPVDPNAAYVSAMSATEKKAYQAALSGTANPKESGYHWETAGCAGAAHHEAIAATGQDETSHDALQSEMTALDKSIDADPRMTAVTTTWAACMADAGYPRLTAIGDAEQSIDVQVQQIRQSAYDGVDQSKLTAAKTSEIDATIKGQLAPLTPIEITTAVADFTCRDSAGYATTQLDVATEYQQKFMDAHKAELDAWLEASLTAKK